MKYRNLFFLALVSGFALTASGCLRRRVIVVHEAYPSYPVQTIVPQPAPASAPAATALVSAPEAPPTPQVETAPPAPAPNYVWVEGYWVWQRGWRWRPGLWVVPPRPLVVWAPGHWERRPHAWIWVPGHWQ